MANRNVIGVDDEPYPLNERCAVPGCAEPSERHHAWRRSFLNGDYWFVQLPDARIIGNCIGLCNTHHRKVTENEAMIAFLDDVYVWGPPEGDVQVLAWQPPGIEHQHERVDNSDVCPQCHQRIKPKTKPEQRKNRRTWSIAVPKDDQENGADVLDTLIDAAREELDSVGLSYGDEHRYRYHVLATSLGLFVQHGQAILSDGRAA